MRSKAWICGFSSTQKTAACCGGLRYNPTMSRTLSMSNGSGDSLKLFVRCGCSPKACQMRCTLIGLTPVAFASVRVLQWVAPRGVVSNVRVTTASTCVSLIVRGAPGRGSSSSPSTPLSINRCRQRPTVGFDIRSFFATVVLSSPVAHASTIRARRASWGAVRARCAIESSTCRSTFVTTNAALGRAIVHLLSPCTTGGGLLFT